MDYLKELDQELLKKREEHSSVIEKLKLKGFEVINYPYEQDTEEGFKFCTTLVASFSERAMYLRVFVYLYKPEFCLYLSKDKAFSYSRLKTISYVEGLSIIESLIEDSSLTIENNPYIWGTGYAF